MNFCKEIKHSREKQIRKYVEAEPLQKKDRTLKVAHGDIPALAKVQMNRNLFDLNRITSDIKIYTRKFKAFRYSCKRTVDISERHDKTEV